ANIAWIIRNGADKFASLGTEKSKGTKVFSLSGKVKRTGLIEVPMGITLREIIFDIAGGIKDDKKFKAVQVGGPSGGCIPESLLDTPVDYDSLSATGAIMGSGGMVVMDEDTCMVSVAKYFLNFTQNESCGKCTFCRVGTKRMYETLDRITEGKGVPEDLDKLEELAYMTKESSLCGLGQTAPNPVLTTLKYFRDEYKAHIIDKKCPAKECKALIKYEIDPDKCKSCSICARNCPVNAISGEKGIPYVIDQSACIKCGNCLRVCPFGAVEVK
ncbi:MAG TPA: 4Fe-4S dicluster domain-containing protein, partial [Firmicutes bacterium]|nr:4Fe-4S dicluster domain-containing protein [Bacillota bacterium]